MLFFFELLLFALIMLTLGLAEFVGPRAALGVWLASTGASLLGYLLARRALGRGGPRAAPPASSPPLPGREDGGGAARGPTRQPRRARRPDGAQATLDEKWARSLLYYWWRTNVLLLTGALVLIVWDYLRQ